MICYDGLANRPLAKQLVSEITSYLENTFVQKLKNSCWDKILQTQETLPALSFLITHKFLVTEKLAPQHQFSINHLATKRSLFATNYPVKKIF